MKLFSLDNYLVMAFMGGLTMTVLAWFLSMPDMTFQIIGTLIMFAACLIWTIEETT